MSEAKKGQVISSAAQVYEDFFVPALFHSWATKIVDEAEIEKGQKVLDVACGTGVLAAEAQNKTGPEGYVCGLDLNEGMLAVASQKDTPIDWKQGAAESIPFENEVFDAVVSQFGLMFFEDKVAALTEMFRVLKTGGKLVVAVWDSLENTDGYLAVVGMLKRLFGDEAADALRSPYSLGDPEILTGLFEEAGITEAHIRVSPGKARFPSIESWMFTDVKGWTLANIIDDEQYQLLLREAESELRQFVIEDGTVEFEHPAFIISAIKT